MVPFEHHYTQGDLLNAIRRAGIEKGDVVSLQVSLGRVGLPEGASNAQDISDLVIDTFLDALGLSGTLIVPTYTYSIGRGEVFEVETTPSSIGEFTEVFRRRPGVIRSRDPMLSSAGIGPGAAAVLREISTSCYGEGSSFDRLKQVGAKICTLGISLYWATFRHHIEEMAAVPFRFKKRFTGLVCEAGVTRKETWTYFAAPLIENCEPIGLPLEKKARAAGLVAVEPVGRGELMCIGAREYFEFGIQELRKDPWLTAKGPPCSLAELVRLEDARVGAAKLNVLLPENPTIAALIDGLSGLPRDIVSEGMDAALAAIETQLPLQIHEYSTGTQFGQAIVPEKWTCREAFLATADGRRIFAYSDDRNHVPPYSLPFKGSVDRQQLIEHLFSSSPESDRVPFRSLLGEGGWGLCCSGKQLGRLHDDRYEVLIDCAQSYGMLKVGESTVSGRSGRTVLVISRLDRRARALQGMAGPAVAIAAMKQLADRAALEPTVRLLLVPGSTGLAAWTVSNEETLSKVAWVIILDAMSTILRPTLLPPSTLLSPLEDETQTVCETISNGRDANAVPSTEVLLEASAELVSLVGSVELGGIR